MIKAAPSVLSANFLELGKDIECLNSTGADYIHYDVMDGRFVPNISFGQNILKQVSRIARIPLDVHLMIVEPEKYIESFAQAGASIITVHAEAARHLHRVLHMIRELGLKAGVSLNPATSPDCLEYVMGDFDLALVMSVNPGFGGQKMIPSAIRKVKEIHDLMESNGVSAEIEVDGGITLETAPAFVEAGATILVAGSAYFGAEDRKAFIDGLHAL